MASKQFLLSNGASKLSAKLSGAICFNFALTGDALKLNNEFLLIEFSALSFCDNKLISPNLVLTISSHMTSICGLGKLPRYRTKHSLL